MWKLQGELLLRLVDLILGELLHKVVWGWGLVLDELLHELVWGWDLFLDGLLHKLGVELRTGAYLG